MNETDHAGAGDHRNAKPDRTYLLSSASARPAVVQLYADAFRDLPLRERTPDLASSARPRIAGRDNLSTTSVTPHNLEMRDVPRSDRDPHAGRRRSIDAGTKSRATHQAVSGSTAGPYNNLTSRKFVLACRAPRGPSRPRPHAGRAGRAPAFPLRPRRDARRACSRALEPMFFDPPASIPPSPARRPRAGKDIITASREQSVRRP